ncbi:hypothetical protein E2562_015458 [Oryza meyeriana var. granulata]|uniref:Uncharacterized protein n=1 Tax=Oryza meyeriana var. granulata TaxID=110450 RepID=A0A6G1BXK5_9ORYZ|nr:hypothetical protein E2562_015458 [Oryza meyeriana var. granulata]
MSIKDSTSKSITVTGKKMKVSEVGVLTSSSSAGQNEDPNQVIVSGVGGDTRNQEEGQHTLSTVEIIALDDDDPEEEEVAGSTGKRKKRCTSVVWQYFTKKTVVVEVDGKKYEQLWGYCNFPRCKQRHHVCNPKCPLNDEEDDSESDPDEMDDAGEL